MVVEQASMGLTPRQVEILTLVAKGLSNVRISEHLGISQNTVRVHLASITRHLGVSNRTEAAALYHQTRQPDPHAALAERIGRPRIAVLSFRPQTENFDPYLLSGLRDDLVTRLSAWRWFPVIAPTPTELDAQEDLTRAAERMEARYLIHGTIGETPKRFRLNVVLWESESRTTVWSESFEFERTEMLDIQDRSVEQIMAVLAPELVAYETRRASTPTSTPFDAWDLTMRGMWLLAHRTREEVDEAERQFHRAAEIDPTFSLPWFGLVWVHHHALVEQWSRDRSTSRSRLETAVETCKRLDADAAHTHIAAGILAIIKGQRDEAIHHLERAAFLNPSSSQALALLGQCHCLSDDADQCIAVVEEALLLNPFNPNAWSQKAVIALAHYAAGRYEEALELARQALSRRPRTITAHIVLVATLATLGDAAGAANAYRELMNARPDFDVERHLELIAPVADPRYIERIRAAFADASRSCG
jgi:TolB-like protein/Tfp pilus assembly protein PilF